MEAPAPVAAGIGLDAAPDCAPGPGTAPPRRHRGPHSPWLGLVPAMLPMDPVTFIGRRPELDCLLQELRGEGSGRRAVVLTGEAGAGTSSLAVRAGHLCRDDFRQGQLYIDLRREGGGAKNPWRCSVASCGR